jgi:hypothetical protein
MVGTHFQAEYHQQKMADAHQSVLNGIQANKTKERLLLTGVHNYHLPKPVLGQRIYANPSLGASSYTSGRRDGADAPFRVVESGSYGSGMCGGAITSAGRNFYNAKLQSRIEELNRLNALAQGFAVPAGQSDMVSDNTKMGGEDKVNFFLLLEFLTDDVEEGLKRFSFDNVKIMLRDCFSFAPVATETDFNDMLDRVDNLLEVLRNGMSEEPTITVALQDNATAESLLVVVESMRNYITEMFRNMYLSERDRRTLSKSLIKTLDFIKIMKTTNANQLVNEARKGNERVNQAAEDFDDDDDAGDDDDDDGHFEKPTEAREDEEQPGVARAPFAGNGGDPNKEKYGESRGDYAQVAWFGEATAADMPTTVAPLALSGFDPETQIPGPDPNVLRDALDVTIQTELESAGKAPNDTRSDEDIINALYPNPNTFVDNVVSAMTEKNFSPAEIARAMTMMPIKQFAQYIADNTGEIAPQRIYKPSALPQMPAFPPPAAPAPAPAPAPSGGATWYPRTREILRSDFNTFQKLKALADRIPPEFGSYSPRQDTKIKNIQQHIINLIKAKVDGY